MAKTIPRAEWDFSKCPPDEAHDCWAWEYSRECKLIKEDVRQLRIRKRKKTFDAYFKSIGMDIFKGKHGRTMHPLYLCPEFPEHPYSSVPSRERKRRRTVMFGDEETAMAATIGAHGWLPDNIGLRVDRAFRTGEPIYPIGPNELVMLRINWELTNNILKEQFMSWLKKNRPKDVKQHSHGHGVPTTQMKYRLKDLGVWRLLNAMDYADAAALTEQMLGRALYNDQGSWTASRNRASDMLEAFTQSETSRIQNSTSPNS